MARLELSLAALALAQVGLGCGAAHDPMLMPGDAEPSKHATGGQMAATTPPVFPPPKANVPEPGDAGEPGLSPPPPGRITGGLPPPAPACPMKAPTAGSDCSVPAATALSCAWDQDGGIERCACVSKEGAPEGVSLKWNCDDGPSGEGPSISTCPDTPPAAGSPCLLKGNNCRYVMPSVVSCDCDPGELRWKCDQGAQGGA